MSECTGPGCNHPEHGSKPPVVIKYDENGEPIYDTDPRAGSRAERRRLARQARRATPPPGDR